MINRHFGSDSVYVFAFVFASEYICCLEFKLIFYTVTEGSSVVSSSALDSRKAEFFPSSAADSEDDHGPGASVLLCVKL